MASSAIKRLRTNRWNVVDKVLFAAAVRFNMTLTFRLNEDLSEEPPLLNDQADEKQSPCQSLVLASQRQAGSVKGLPPPS